MATHQSNQTEKHEQHLKLSTGEVDESNDEYEFYSNF